MKKTLLIGALVICALTASAQRTSTTSSSSFFSTASSDEDITWGVEVGMNFASLGGDYGKDLDSKLGFNVGVIVDFPILESLHIKSGLQYTVKGAKYEESYSDSYYDESESVETKYNAAYLEIPILLSYRYAFSETTKLQVNFGPYIAYGIGGKCKEEWSRYYSGYYDSGEEEWDTFGDDEDSEGVKRFDYGLSIGAGLTIASHYYIGFGYEFGLANILDKDVWGDNYDCKTKNLFINIGYTF